MRNYVAPYWPLVEKLGSSTLTAASNGTPSAALRHKAFWETRWR